MAAARAYLTGRGARPYPERQTMTRRSARISLVAALLAAGGVTTLIVAQPALAATAAFTKTSTWDTGYQAQFTITNNTSATTTSWNVQFDLPAGTSMGTYCDALVTTSGQHVTAINRNYNGTLAPRATTTFGFVAAGTRSSTNCTVNGAACGGGGTPTTTRPPATAPPTTPPPTTAPPPTTR